MRYIPGVIITPPDLLPTLRGQGNFRQCRPPDVADIVGMGGTPTSQQARQVGQAAVLPRQWRKNVLRGQRATSAPLDHTSYPLHERGGKLSLFDPTLRNYWQARQQRTVPRRIRHKDKLELLRRQAGVWGLGRLPLKAEGMDDHYPTPRQVGGQKTLDKEMLVHRWCRHTRHQRVGFKGSKA